MNFARQNNLWNYENSDEMDSSMLQHHEGAGKKIKSIQILRFLSLINLCLQVIYIYRSVSIVQEKNF